MEVTKKKEQEESGQEGRRYVRIKTRPAVREIVLISIADLWYRD
jgi:hypothetical protein